MSVAKIRGWLLQLPRPHKVRVSGDGEPQILKPGKSAAKLAESIAALGVELIEALDAEDNILRALRLDTEETRRSDAAPIPEALERDPQALLLTHFANLLHRAYEHSTEVAFTRLVELVEKMGDRSDSIEARLERTEAANRQLMRDQVDDAFERAEEVAARAASGDGGGLGEQLLGSFLGGKMHGAAAGAAGPKNGASNGKGHG